MIFLSCWLVLRCLSYFWTSSNFWMKYSLFFFQVFSLSFFVYSYLLKSSNWWLVNDALLFCIILDWFSFCQWPMQTMTKRLYLHDQWCNFYRRDEKSVELCFSCIMSENVGLLLFIFRNIINLLIYHEMLMLESCNEWEWRYYEK